MKKRTLPLVSVEEALMHVKEVAPGTALPNKLWERSARALAARVRFLESELATFDMRADVEGA